MAEILKFRKPDRRAQAEGKTLCKSGFHRWRAAKEPVFDVKRGKLVTLLRCLRCGMQRRQLT